jgi:hypothetical protein
MIAVIFIFLSAAVVAFLLMLCLRLFRIERTMVMTLMTAERKIVKNYSSNNDKGKKKK